MTRQTPAQAFRIYFHAFCIGIIAAYVALSIAAPGLALCVFRGECG